MSKHTAYAAAVTQATAPAGRRQSNWPAMTTVLLLVIGFTYSDDIVEFALDLSGRRFADTGPWLVFALDGLLVLGTLALKWRISGRDSALRTFLRRQVTGLWGIGAALVVVSHLVLIGTAAPRARLEVSTSVWVSLLFTLVFVTAMALMLVSVLSEGNTSASRGWVVPLVLGTLAAQFASALWYPVIDVQEDCSDVASWFFSDIAHITPVVLLTLGLELNYVRRNTTAQNAGVRVAPVLTVMMLGVSEILALSMMVKAETPQCGMAAVWHEYIAFVFTAQSMTTGLATLMWLLVKDSAQE